MSVHEYMDLSTGHVTQKDMELLDGDTCVIAYPYKEGAFVIVPPDLNTELQHRQDIVDAGFSVAFLEMLQYAFDAGVLIVRLDADGDQDESLPTFDW